MIPHASSYYVCELCEQLDDTKGVTISYKSKKIYNTMAKRYTIQWPKDIQHNGQKKTHKGCMAVLCTRRNILCLSFVFYIKNVWLFSALDQINVRLFFVREETYYVCPLSSI